MMERLSSSAPRARSGKWEIHYVPTPGTVVVGMLRLADVKASDVVYDLGCGDGRIVIAAARDCGARGVGVDIDPKRIRECYGNARKSGVLERVRFVQGNLFDIDLKEATVVALYLVPDLNRRLRPRFLRELRAGARIVSHGFAMGDWKPDRQAVVEGHHLFLWVIPPTRMAL
ncbi:MAG: methyltransferase domain-containing protein [Bacillota bacterium]